MIETSLEAENTTGTPVPQPRRRLFPAVLLSALLSTLAFPPLDAGFLAWISLAPLLYVLPQARRTRHAFGLGYLFGVTHWGMTILWIGTTVSAWTHSPIGWVAWVLLVAIKSCWFGLFGALAWWIGRRREGLGRALGMACAWTLVEWFRGQTSVAMPWSLIGYTQYRYLPLIQVSELAGVYAVTFLIAFTNGGIAEFLRGGRKEWRLIAVPMSLVVLAAGYGLLALGREYTGPKARLALMQPNIRTIRRDVEPTREELLAAAAAEREKFRRMTAKVEGQRVQMVVWPESAAPVSAVTDPDDRSLFGELARRMGAYQFAGTGYEDVEERTYNSAALFGPDGMLLTRYDKTWLVPMGEWVPLRRWMPFSEVFHFPQDTTAGTADQVLEAGAIRMCPLICYESVFPIVPRTRAAKGANLLVSITNDSWAGESAELQQHIAMAVFRAVETRRCLASSATTGITGLIGPKGDLTAISPYREDSLVLDATLLEGLTPYVRFGDWLVALCAGWLLYVLLRRKPLAG